MRRWIITGLAVLTLVGLAITAGRWVPALLAPIMGSGQNAALIQPITAVVQLGLWLLAALAGALGVWRAIGQHAPAEASEAVAEPAAEAEQVEPRPAGNGNGRGKRQPSPAAAKARSAVRANRATPGNGSDDTDLVQEEEVVMLRTPGGVRIIAEGSTLDLDTAPGTGWLRPLTDDLDETVVQALDPCVAAELSSPSPAPLSHSAFNLPADLADFTGRTAELASVRRQLSQESAANICIIAGMGGIGKTSLALHVAHQVAGEELYPDGQLYIDLKGTDPAPVSPVAALTTLLAALQGPSGSLASPPPLGQPQGAEGAGGGQDEVALSGVWQAALQGKKVLLVLDNAANAAQVEPLLPGSSTCGVLLTSRQRFTLPGSALLDLSRLKPDEARTLLLHLAPGLDGAADQIVELCGGLPLALRIAGNYLALNDNLTPGDYVELLSDERKRLAHLRDPNNPNLDVSATLSLSVAQLDAGAHWAWHLLALFPAPFDQAAAAALWGEGVGRDAWVPLDGETTVGWLSALHNRSLVSFDASTGRYHLHDLLRLAASRELDQSRETAEAQARMAYHFLAVAQRVDERQRYPDLDPDWPHLQASLKNARRDVALQSDLVLALNNYWSVRGMARERADWSRRAAKACAEAHRRREQGMHLGNLGSAYADLGDARRAIEYYGQALTLSRGTGDRRVEAMLMGNLGRAYAALGELQRAVHYHEQALDIVQQVRDRRGEGIQLGDLGSAYVAMGEPRKAIECQIRGLAIARDLEDQRMQGTLLSRLGRAYAALGDLRQAIECQKQALGIHRQVGDRHGEASALDSLGRAYTDVGQPQRAVDYYDQAIEITQGIGDRRAEGAELGNLGQAYAEMGDARRAIQYYGQALSIAQEVGDRRLEGAWQGNLGRAYLQLGDVPQAVSQFQQALDLSKSVNDRRSQATWLGNLGQAHARLGQIDQAMGYHEEAVSIYQEIGDRRSEGNYLASMGMLARMQGDADRAHEVWLGAFQTLESLQDPNAGQVWQWLAELEGQTP